jgi:hypothetical protein
VSSPCSSLIALALVATALRAEGAMTARKLTFDEQKPGQPPQGFTCTLTGGGRPGSWKILADGTAPSRPNVLAQLDADATSYRFPVCAFDGVSARDVDLSVRFKPVEGTQDQAAGLVWRYRDKDNYYVVRANALENNVVLYKVQNGKRSDLDPRGAGSLAYGKKARVPSGTWSTLRVLAKGRIFEVHLDGQKLFEVEDATFAGAGLVGLWTKADSVTCFDDLELTVLD